MLPIALYLNLALHPPDPVILLPPTHSSLTSYLQPLSSPPPVLPLSHSPSLPQVRSLLMSGSMEHGK
ncbi:4-diphosphocytidyl-2-C-methyl-D-erythritol kinase [Dissostichus eleginoides]|uniref:4-diphosphocytidyl-2-C-methyl-D-erythritol kinase n=1 Tax=Dissostichus eleginoides TaxID=100907 RepID=A0AAD9BH33_DISEL|nr:4-diphosphocytidyl-2-C-methyl-D-erythritol kinase [Dissostichus eleginoides]